MRKLILLAILILIFSTNMYCQKWTYSSGGNAFDGKYKTSSIKGVVIIFSFFSNLASFFTIYSSAQLFSRASLKYLMYEVLQNKAVYSAVYFTYLNSWFFKPSLIVIVTS